MIINAFAHGFYGFSVKLSSRFRAVFPTNLHIHDAYIYGHFILLSSPDR